MVKVIHQIHDYTLPGISEVDFFWGRTVVPWYGAEARQNFKLLGGLRHNFDLKDATHVLTINGIEPPRERERRFRWLVTSIILVSERSRLLLPLVWLIDAMLRMRETVRFVTKGKPHERKMSLWQDYLRFE
jgi:hypothetical protein